MSQEDRAQSEEAVQWELLNRPRPPAPEFTPGEAGYGPEFCANEDCGEPMPELRRRAGRHFCTDCQSSFERSRARHYG